MGRSPGDVNHLPAMTRADSPSTSRRRSAWIASVLCGLCTVGQAQVWALAGPGEPAPAETAGVWIERLQSAATSQSYEGTLVFSAGSVVSSSRVAHYAHDGQAWEQIEALDGRAARSYRYNDSVVSFWPDKRVVTVGQRDETWAGPLRTVPHERLQAHYDVRLVGTDLVAGRRVQVLLLSPRDEWRYTRRLWVDAASGLMLRADVLGPRGEVLESSSFSAIEIGVRPQAETVRAAMRRTSGWQVLAMPSVPVRLQSEGWSLGAGLPPGFQLTGCVRKPVVVPATEPRVASEPGAAAAVPGATSGLQAGPAGGAARTERPAADTLHAVFSDGLTRVSMFIEPQPAGRPAQTIATRLGATHTLVQPLGEQWRLVLMGEVPVSTLRRFAAALERR
jgi:sigma-E factor negative regulatory protein RseB